MKLLPQRLMESPEQVILRGSILLIFRWWSAV
jgi:hypothetical protein